MIKKLCWGMHILIDAHSNVRNMSDCHISLKSLLFTVLGIEILTLSYFFYKCGPRQYASRGSRCCIIDTVIQIEQLIPTLTIYDSFVKITVKTIVFNIFND